MEKYPELDALAKVVADVTAYHINRAARDVESAMPYKAQYVLEKTLELLQARV